jgi:hypothetical protein
LPIFRGVAHAKRKQTNPNTMPDILYILASIGFFALMIAFIWACEKV